MFNFLNTWRPSVKQAQDVYDPKPDFVPDWVYNDAKMCKCQYNTNWEFWVWQVSQRDNVPLPIAEDACIRGIKKEFLRYRLIYGDRVGSWFEDFLDMNSVFRKVKHNDYRKQLGD